MKSPKRTKLVVLLLFVIVGAVGLSFPFRAYVLAPYQMRQEQLRLPVMPASLSLADLGIPPGISTLNCPDLAPTLGEKELEEALGSLRTKLHEFPGDLCAGNQFREAVRYQQLRSGDFAIQVNSLPTALASIARDTNSIPTSPANSSKVSADELEPAKSFKVLIEAKSTNTPETQLQLGLSYVDLMIRQGGREHKARLSSRSIEALSSALQHRPYMLAALYARGLNYLYWPIIAGKLPLAIQDLKTCIALSYLPPIKEHPPLVIAAAYTALGDAYAKLADSALSQSQQSDLLKISRSWWEQGLQRFPKYIALEQRLTIAPDRLTTYIDSRRGLETYIDTDLDQLWDRQGPQERNQ